MWRRRGSCPIRWRSGTRGARLEAAAARALGSAAGGALRGERGARGPTAPTRRRPGRRALRARALGVPDRARPGGARRRGRSSRRRGNMTERMAALALLVAHGQARGGAGGVPCRLGARPAGRRQVVLGAGGAAPRRSAAVATVERLTRHPDFDWKNPNRLRALDRRLRQREPGRASMPRTAAATGWWWTG